MLVGLVDVNVLARLADDGADLDFVVASFSASNLGQKDGRLRSSQSRPRLVEETLKEAETAVSQVRRWAPRADWERSMASLLTWHLGDDLGLSCRWILSRHPSNLVDILAPQGWEEVLNRPESLGELGGG
jgi:hypothetical protein